MNKSPILNSSSEIENDERTTVEIISDYWQQVANYWRLKNKDWYKEDIAFHRQIWLSCVDIISATNYEFYSGTAVEDVDIIVGPMREALTKIWFAGGSMVVQGILYHHDGEYQLRHAHAIARQFRDMWEGGYDEVHFFDYVETIIVDACASQQINITCLRALTDITQLQLTDLCLVPNDIKSTN